MADEQNNQPKPHHARTYEDDVEKAMNAVDATTVQEMLATARAREESERLSVVGKRQRRLYTIFSVIFLLLAAAGFTYGIYRYLTLTVPVEQRVPVGVFKNTAPVVIGETTIGDLVEGLAANPSLEEEDPTLVPLVTDPATLVPVDKMQFFEFIQAKPTEPFTFVIDTIRLGALANDGKTSTFIVLSVTDPQLASKEFLIAEPNLLQYFSAALGIKSNSYAVEVGKTYDGTYLYNLPVRVLTDSLTGKPILIYGFATNNVIVICTDPIALKAVSDTIMKQVR